jgi:glutamine amidotransferase
MIDIAIIDYGMGNLYSLYCACKVFGFKTKITNDEEIIKKSKIIILPGVGAFPDAMRIIKKKKLDYIILKNFEKNKKIIGICLGMQLLFDSSNEFKITKGLGLVKGEVLGFNPSYFKSDYSLNVGWNRIIKKNVKNNLLENIKKQDKFYFIHSYYCKPKDQKIITTNSFFNKNQFCSSIKSKNIEAFQFHPEKSSLSGLKIFKNIKKELNEIFI